MTAAPAAIYVSTGEGTVADPLPDAFKLSGNSDLRGGVSREAGFASPASVNRARLPEGNAHDPIDPMAWVRIADIAHERSMPLTVEAESCPFTYTYDLWRQDENECRRRIGLVATALAVCRARQPKLDLRVEFAAPAPLTVPSDGPIPGYRDLLDYEASVLAPLVSGPVIGAYWFEGNSVAVWEAGVAFYLAEATKRYKGTSRLLLSPKVWAGGDERGYVGDAAMDHMMVAFPQCQREFWGTANVQTQKPVPEFWRYLRWYSGKGKGRDSVPGASRD